MPDRNLPDLVSLRPANAVATTDTYITRQGADTEDRGGSITGLVTFLKTLWYLIPTRIVTAAGAVTVTAADYYVGINKTTGAATVVNIPAASAVPGQQFIIKDEKLDAATNNITITPASGNIVGATRATTFVMNTAGQAATIVSNGTEWAVV